jgi:hypothetical protein
VTIANRAAKAWALLLRLRLIARVDGLRPALVRAWSRLFGSEERYVFVQQLKPPAAPVTLPVETNGMIVRQMTARDRDNLPLRRQEPWEINDLALGFVITRDDQIIGAEWYTDSVRPGEEWYPVVEPHLLPPAWFDANMFVVPGEKGAAWALFKTATDVVATSGVRCTVALVGTRNKPSIFLLRLLGAKIVGRIKVRYRFGRKISVAEPVTEDKTGI